MRYLSAACTLLKVTRLQGPGAPCRSDFTEEVLRRRIRLPRTARAISFAGPTEDTTLTGIRYHSSYAVRAGSRGRRFLMAACLLLCVPGPAYKEKIFLGFTGVRDIHDNTDRRADLTII